MFGFVIFCIFLKRKIKKYIKAKKSFNVLVLSADEIKLSFNWFAKLEDVRFLHLITLEPAFLLRIIKK